MAPKRRSFTGARLVSFAALALGLLLPVVAAAAPSAADKASARELGKEAEAAMAQKDYATAADKYAKAEALFHAPTLLLGLARAQVGLGRLVDAQETYQRLVNETLPPDAPKFFTDAVQAAKTEVGAIAGRISWITVKVTGVDAPSVTIDGAAIPAAALGVRRAIDPGNHEIVVSVQGAVAKRVSVVLGEGQSQTVPVAVEPPPKADVPPSVSVPAKPPESPPPPPTAGPWIIGGIGLAALVAGGVTGGLTLQKKSAVSSDGCVDSFNGGGPACPTQAGINDAGAGRTLGLVTTVSLSVGGAALAAGAIWLGVSRSNKSTARFGVVPTASGATWRMEAKW
jgi:hypothetical protein